MSAPRIVDLTLTLTPGMRGFEMEPKFVYSREGWNASTLHLYSHCGTHMDAPIHFEAGPGTIDQLPPGECIGRAWVVNVHGLAPKALIDVGALGGIGDRFQRGESLLLRTDWSQYAAEPAIYRDGLPRVSEALAQWCVDRGVKMLGVEPPSVADVNNRAEVTLIHKILLSGGVTIVEGLTNLNQLEREQVLLIALPLKPLQGDGSPCRAIAIEGAPALLEAWRSTWGMNG